MCLDRCSLSRIIENDKKEDQRFYEITKPKLDGILNKIEPGFLQSEKDLKTYLQRRRLTTYVVYANYFLTKECKTYWEDVWNKGQNVDTALCLYELWWKRVNHARKYCMNPRQFAKALLLFAQAGNKALMAYRCKTLQEERIKDALCEGFVRYHAACVILRHWRMYQAHKNQCASKISMPILYPFRRLS